MEVTKDIIYLDNNATTLIDKRVLDAMLPFYMEAYANANSTHLFGLAVNDAVKIARKRVGELIGAESNEIVFTSGATEAINIAIKGAVSNYSAKGKHIITVNTEHSAVIDTCKYLESVGFEVTYLSVGKDGLVDLQELNDTINDGTVLVSVMIANNETGVLQPIIEIGKIAHSFGAIFMTDATQAVGKIPIDVDKLGIDLLCLSGHKIYAPKGIGALYVRQRRSRIRLSTFIHGGGHEKGLRSGTLNVPGIVALGMACSLAKKEMDRNKGNILNLRNYLEAELLNIEGTSINGNTHSRLYNTTNILFRGIDSDAMIMGLSNTGSNLPMIAVSNGSACTSTSIEPSHVLTAMGLDEVAAFGSIRFSLGKFNTKEEIDVVIDAVKNVVKQLRTMTGSF